MRVNPNLIFMHVVFFVFLLYDEECNYSNHILTETRARDSGYWVQPLSSLEKLIRICGWHCHDSVDDMLIVYRTSTHSVHLHDVEIPALAAL